MLDKFKEGPFEGFYTFENFPNYCFNVEGKIIRISDNKEYDWYITKPQPKKNITGGYAIKMLPDASGKRRGVFRHRVLAKLFIEVPKELEGLKLVVNHKNGIPGDDRIENLEWCTYSQNTQHAYDNGLHSNKTRAVLVKCKDTGEVMRFPTIEKASNLLGWSWNCIRNRLKRQPGCFYDGFAVKDDDDTPWGDGLRKLTCSKPAKAFNVYTHEVVVADTIAELARLTGLEGSSGVTTARDRIVRDSKHPWKGWIHRYNNDDRPWPKYTKRELQIIEANKAGCAVGVSVRDCELECDMFFVSMSHAARFFKVERQQIARYGRSGKLLFKRYKLNLIKVT